MTFKYIGDEYLSVRDQVAGQEPFIRNYLAGFCKFDVPTNKEYIYLVDKIPPSTRMKNSIKEAKANKDLANAEGDSKKTEAIREKLRSQGMIFNDEQDVPPINEDHHNHMFH